ncbi:MAG: hypothetical protein A4E42_01394 [Methanoregulaceae archaeon PtaU1.Bin222]|nr:MAG: hypothetical protein A4E42_01394 [Methanoregulaceae archaeon PtaU1.Bin222]
MSGKGNSTDDPHEWLVRARSSLSLAGMEGPGILF